MDATVCKYAILTRWEENDLEAIGGRGFHYVGRENAVGVRWGEVVKYKDGLARPF